jgi:hypothetical protein
MDSGFKPRLGYGPGGVSHCGQGYSWGSIGMWRVSLLDAAIANLRRAIEPMSRRRARLGFCPKVGPSLREAAITETGVRVQGSGFN